MRWIQREPPHQWFSRYSLLTRRNLQTNIIQLPVFPLVSSSASIKRKFENSSLTNSNETGPTTNSEAWTIDELCYKRPIKKNLHTMDDADNSSNLQNFQEILLAAGGFLCHFWVSEYVRERYPEVLRRR